MTVSHASEPFSELATPTTIHKSLHSMVEVCEDERTFLTPPSPPTVHVALSYMGGVFKHERPFSDTTLLRVVELYSIQRMYQCVLALSVTTNNGTSLPNSLLSIKNLLRFKFSEHELSSRSVRHLSFLLRLSRFKLYQLPTIYPGRFYELSIFISIRCS